VPEILSGEVEAWWEILAWAFQRSRNRSIEWEDSRLQLDGPVQRRVVFERIAERLKVRNRVVRQEATEELVAALAPEGPRPALFLNWDGACRLPRGGFTIGSHSEFHAVLSQESPEEQRRDLLASRQRLQHELQVPVDLLAYPNGRACNYDQNTVGVAQQAGYSGSTPSSMVSGSAIVRSVRMPGQVAAQRWAVGGLLLEIELHSWLPWLSDRLPRAEADCCDGSASVKVILDRPVRGWCRGQRKGCWA
jgi:hypothetical protein